MSDVHVDTEMDMAAAEMAATLSQVNGSVPAKPSTQSSDLTRLNATIDRLYDDKRKQLADTTARHAEEHVRTVNDYLRRMDDLKHQAAEAMRALEERHAKELAPLIELLGRLEGMR